MITIERLKAIWYRFREAATPSLQAWFGATLGVYLLATILIVAFFASYIVQDFAVQKLPAYVVVTSALFLIGAIALQLLSLFGKLAPSYRLALFITAPFIVVVFAPGGEMQSAVFAAITVLIASFIGGGVAVLRRDGFDLRNQKVTLTIMALGVAGLFGGLYAIFGEKDSPNPILDDYVVEDRTLDMPNPGLPGDFKVGKLTYGSGRDKHRPEYGANADLVSRSVDGSKLIDNWDGLSGWLRTSYWGFDVSALPLQGRVWYPDGSGRFPLVLIVHGNHAMEDFSDPGYEYLCELLASRGIICASIDENFLNSTVSAAIDLFDNRPGLKEENDARGWLLLEHLSLWRDWNSEPGHRFHNTVDMDRVALIGHSRGGEAVAIAASFNSLERYPDDASQKFDFGFNLRGVIAIAPIDGQYQPRDKGTPIRDVNYFTIHGSMDGDVQSFEGTSQYSRVSFADDTAQRFKASLYVKDANHGQFNTTWGKLDIGIFRAWTLNVDGIMDGEAQRDIARVYFSAFMEVVLSDRKEYLPMFSDVRYAAKWVPNTYYINQYANSAQQSIADFEEDIDPVTATLPGGRIETEHLSKWYETRVTLKYDDLDTNAGVFAWNRKFDEQTGVVRFVLPPDWNGLHQETVLSASISDAGIDSLPEDWEAKEGVSDDGDSDSQKKEQAKPLDWTIELVDQDGQTVSLPLSHDEPLYPLVQAVPRRASFLDPEEPEEILFRRFTFPIDDFVALDPSFDPASVVMINFIFDRSDKGAIIVDDLSFTRIQ